MMSDALASRAVTQSAAERLTVKRDACGERQAQKTPQGIGAVRGCHKDLESMNNNQQQINPGDIEDCIIGALLMTDDFDQLADLVEQCDHHLFTGHHAATAYATISTLVSRGFTPNIVMVFDFAKEIGYSDNLLGGLKYLAHCQQFCPSAKNASKYICRLKDHLSKDDEWSAWVDGRQATAQQACISGINSIIGMAVAKHLAKMV